MEPQTQYARSGDVFIAYQVFGSGTPDLVMVPAFLSHLENTWSEPRVARWLNRLGQHCRVIMFDKRGTGLSDRVAGLPDLEQRMDDVRAVTDAVGSECPALFGLSEGGTMAALYAATNPARCKSLVLWGAFARFQSWYKDEAALERFREYVRTQWGSGAAVQRIAPTLKDDPAFKQFIGRYERLGASPSAVLNLMNMNSQIDVRGVLASIRVPTLIMHRRGDVNVSIEGGRELAAEIPNARFVELPGEDHAPYVGDGAEAIADMIGEFVTGERIEDVGHTTLATVVFTDIVNSTSRAEAMGDAAWNDLLSAHNRVFRMELERFRGREIKSLGDGFLVLFDGPARAIRFSKAVSQAMHALNLEIRLGVHVGEVTVANNDVHGIAVNVAARVVSLAEASEILVSRTVKDLIAGSGIELVDRGVFELKGITEKWQLFGVKS